jgi:hypothetical protein
VHYYQCSEKADDDNDYDSTIEVLGLVTYSNSESIVLSYTSIFELYGYKQS